MKITPELRSEIYKAYHLGETLLSLAQHYGVKETVIRHHIDNYKEGLPSEYYWLNSPSQAYADYAQERFITISRKYNTPSGVKKC